MRVHDFVGAFYAIDDFRLRVQGFRERCHYGFEPQPVAVTRGNEKERVERAVRYVRRAFFRTNRDTQPLG